MKKITTTTLALITVATLAFPFKSAKAAVTKNERVLVVVSELDSRGMQELRPLYQALEQLTQFTVQGILGNSYSRIEVVANRDATYAEFKRALKEIAREPGIRAIDVILSLHGLPGRLSFDDMTWNTSEMENRFYIGNTPQDRVDRILLRRKLRMMYNLSCYGSSHRENFIGMGFKAVNGSIGVNANSEVEFVPALTAWAAGAGFKDAFNGSNSPLFIAAADAPVRLAGQLANNALKETNSMKVFSGDVSMKINSEVR
ncbi:MAG: hypothetical protein AB7I27_08305 [Bacteriovoracaceae bacterium]